MFQDFQLGGTNLTRKYNIRRKEKQRIYTPQRWKHSKQHLMAHDRRLEKKWVIFLNYWWMIKRESSLCFFLFHATGKCSFSRGVAGGNSLEGGVLLFLWDLQEKKINRSCSWGTKKKRFIYFFLFSCVIYPSPGPVVIFSTSSNGCVPSSQKKESLPSVLESAQCRFAARRGRKRRTRDTFSHPQRAPLKLKKKRERKARGGCFIVAKC
jgi:hypothetical protein